MSNAYRLYVDTERCVLYLYDAFREMDCNDYILQTFTGKSLPTDWKLPKHTVEYTQLVLNDFVHGFTEAPFVSQRAKQEIEPIVGKESEFRPIGKILDTDYYIMNVTNVVDCLDPDRSHITYSDDDGRVLSLNQALFLPGRIPDVSLFRVPQDPTPIYATDRFVEVVRKCKLTGVGFEPSNNVGLGLINDAFPDLPLRQSKKGSHRNN